MASLLLATALVQSFNRANAPAFDEGIHLAAGIRAVKCGNFAINPEQPPLVKAIAAWPAQNQSFDAFRSECRTSSLNKVQAFAAGYKVLDSPAGDQFLHRARLQLLVFYLGLIVVIFLAARHWFSLATAIVAVFLVIFEPLITAHAILVGTDMAETLAMFSAIAAALYWLERPTAVRGSMIALAFSLAVAVKHSGPFILPMTLVVMLLGHRFQRRATITRSFITWLCSVGVAWVFLWATYGFRFFAMPGSSRPAYGFHALGLTGFFYRHHLLPEAYLVGLADVLNDSNPLYFFGQYHSQGVWYYFPALMLIKDTLPFLVLLCAAILAGRELWRQQRFLVVSLLLPAVMYLAIAMHRNVNIGLRHILPIYPFLIILMAAGAISIVRHRRSTLFVLTALLGWQAASWFANSPYQLSYANELIGGRDHLNKYINIDGGEASYLVARWSEHTIATPCLIAWESPTPIHSSCQQIAGMSLALFDVEPIQLPEHFDGNILLSDAMLHNRELPFRLAFTREPDAILAGDILIFRGPHDLRLLASHRHIERAIWLVNHHQPGAAIAECAAVDPVYVPPARLNAIHGAALFFSDRAAEARPYLERALTLSTNDPSQSDSHSLAQRLLAQIH